MKSRLIYQNSKFKVPAGLNGNQDRPQATPNGPGHKQASNSLSPFADLVLHGTNLAFHRCEYADNQ